MQIIEPILTKEDTRIWNLWERECRIWMHTNIYKHRVASSIAIILKMRDMCPNAYVSFSGGKDSAAMLYLVASIIPGVHVMSVKDDMDFPGEVEYVKRIADRLKVHIDVLTPDFSLQEWIANNAHMFEVDADIHSQGADLSERAFYNLIDQYRISKGNPGVYIGLRKYESKARMRNRIKRGAIYKKQNDDVVCQPLCDWTGKDLYAYIFEHDIELLPLYRCVRLVKNPDKIRKSWWLMDIPAIGGLRWLKTYYPTLSVKLAKWFPEARARM